MIIEFVRAYLRFVCDLSFIVHYAISFDVFMNVM
jgi:hypothetical protein